MSVGKHLAPKAVIFDLFETLVTEWRPEQSRAPRVWDVLDVPEASYRAAWRSWKHVRHTSELDPRSVWSAITADLGAPAREEMLDDLYQARIAWKQETMTSVSDSVLSMLRELRAAGWLIGVLSNCSVEDVSGWEISPLRELVDAAVFSHEAGVAKPDQAAYAAAADRMGVAPASSVFVGDGGSDELVGAEAAGMRPIRAGWFVAPWGTSVATALARRWQDFEVADDPEELVQRLATGRGN